VILRQAPEVCKAALSARYVAWQTGAHYMTPRGMLSRFLGILGVFGILAALTVGRSPLIAQQPAVAQRPPAAPSPDRVRETSDWPLHNRDISNTRFSPLTAITTANVAGLKLAWSFDATPANISEITPIVINGTMYAHAGSRLFALNAATGAPVWTYNLEPSVAGGAARGPAYGGGRIYAFTASRLYAVDAATGEPIASFGTRGALSVVNAALAFKYPGKYAADIDPTSVGYVMTTPPTYADGTLYVAVGQSDNHLPGGLVMALDGATGAVKWVFNTIPQGPQDDGWELAKDTWGSGARVGGGVWTQPAVDTELGMIYFNATNPAPAFDGSARVGMNLFTDSTIALNRSTGKLVWYFQAVHHDLWDWDFVNGPMLVDVTLGGKTVKAIAAAGKTCYVYLWNRETGAPVHPIVETTVPTKTDVPGEQVWPTQPLPYAANGLPQLPFCPTYPIITDPALAARVRPMFQPFSSTEFFIVSPGVGGGANFGSPSFSRRTGFMYFTARNEPASSKIKPMGDTGRAGSKSEPFYENRGTIGETGAKAGGTLAAYSAATGQQVWYHEFASTTVGGNLVTAGNVVFQGTSRGDFFGIDASTGRELFKYSGRRGIRASPLTYQVNGKQYVAVVAANTVLTFALP
jgi:glucose dehydrogenase